MVILIVDVFIKDRSRISAASLIVCPADSVNRFRQKQKNDDGDDHNNNADDNDDDLRDSYENENDNDD